MSRALALETIPIIYYKSVTLCCLVWKIKFKDTYDRLILADATDEYEAEESNLARARRGQTTEGIKGKHVPEIPEHVLKTARDASSGKGAVSVILKWKRIRNKENRDLRPDELQQKPTPKKESNPSHKKGGKETRKQKRRRLSLSHNEPSKKRRVIVVMTGVSKIVRPPNSPLRMCLKVAFLLI